MVKTCLVAKPRTPSPVGGVLEDGPPLSHSDCKQSSIPAVEPTPTPPAPPPPPAAPPGISPPQQQRTPAAGLSRCSTPGNISDDVDWGALLEQSCADEAGRSDYSSWSSGTEDGSLSGEDFAAIPMQATWVPVQLPGDVFGTAEGSTGDSCYSWCETMSNGEDVWTDDSGEGAPMQQALHELATVDQPTTVDLGALATSCASFGVVPSTTSVSTDKSADAMPTSMMAMQLQYCVPAPSRENKHARQSEPEPQMKCPVCHATAGVIRPNANGTTKMSNIFAQYVPRMKPRKDNPLAPWYAKRGYCGPPYCKVCAESFSSHLLKKPKRSKKAKCSRESPCPRCTIILSRFNVSKETLFSAVDARAAKIQNVRSQKPTKVPLPPDHPPDASFVHAEKTSPLLGTKRKQANLRTATSTKRKQLAALSVGALAVVALLVAGAMHHGDFTSQLVQWNSPNGSQPGWACGIAAATSLLNATSSGNSMASVCEGKPVGYTFPCRDVNDCAAGQVPIGPRKCRCDGCVQTGGRCAGWVLEGYGPSPTYAGCESINPDPEPYVWKAPGNVTRDQCTNLCAEAQGCYRSGGGNTNALHEHTETHGAQCELFFPRAWPQPQTQSWDGNEVTYYAQNGAVIHKTVRSGTIWTDYSHSQENAAGDLTPAAAGNIWYYTIDDGGSRGDATGNGKDYGLDPELSPSADLHIMWQYDAPNRVWRAVPSSLSVRPIPRAGAGRWVGSSGSLFLLGGISSADMIPTTNGIVPFSSVDSVHVGSAVRQEGMMMEPRQGDLMELWKYNTQLGSWHPLHPDRRARSERGSETESGARAAGIWPLTRSGAAVWRDRGLRVPESDSSQETVWVFGGWAGLNQDLGIGSQLWQYMYTDGRYASGSDFDGQWMLVMDSVQSPDTVCQQDPACRETLYKSHIGWTAPVHVCRVDRLESALNTGLESSGTAQGREGLAIPICPRGRKNAASWASPNGGTGELLLLCSVYVCRIVFRMCLAARICARCSDSRPF